MGSGGFWDVPLSFEIENWGLVLGMLYRIRDWKFGLEIVDREVGIDIEVRDYGLVFDLMLKMKIQNSLVFY